ncbi:MAG: tetratricopeptide repeat protein [Thermoplasmatota archaeon]
MDGEYDVHVESVKLLSEAEENFRIGNYDDTRELLNESAALDPTLGRTWELMGMCDITAGDFESAEYNFDSARGCSGYFELAEVANSVMDSTSWNKTNPETDTVQRLTLLGEAYLKDRMWDAAAACYRPLLDMVEPSWRLYSILGLIHREMGNLEPSLEFYNMASEMPDSPPEVLSDLSVVMIKIGKLDEAEELINSILDDMGDVPQLLNNLGAVLEAKGEKDSARDAYERAMEIDEGYYPALYSIGRLLQQEGKMDEAREYLNRALDIEGRIYDLKDVTTREDRESDGNIHVKEIMTPIRDDN